jgi:hypothetical protein
MKAKERYTVYNQKKQVLLRTDDIKEALEKREQHKQDGAYIEDRKSKKKHQQNFFR